MTLTDIVTICLHVSFPNTPQTTPNSHCYFLSRVPCHAVNKNNIHQYHSPLSSPPLLFSLSLLLSLATTKIIQFPWAPLTSFIHLALTHTSWKDSSFACSDYTLLHPLNSFHALVSFFLSLPPLISPPSFVFKVEMPGSDDWQPNQP